MLLLPRGLGREVCLFEIYVLRLAGLLRILCQVLQAGRSVLCLPSAVSEWLMHVLLHRYVLLLSRTVSYYSA